MSGLQFKFFRSTQELCRLSKPFHLTRYFSCFPSNLCFIKHSTSYSFSEFSVFALLFTFRAGFWLKFGFQIFMIKSYSFATLIWFSSNLALKLWKKDSFSIHSSKYFNFVLFYLRIVHVLITFLHSLLKTSSTAFFQIFFSMLHIA